MSNIFELVQNPNLISLGGGLPDPKYFPFNAIEAKVPATGHWEDGGEEQTLQLAKFSKSVDIKVDLARVLQYGQGSGNAQLLDWMKEHTRIIHHPPYEDWSCMMTAGNTNAIDTCIRMLLNRGDTLLIEEYTFPSVLECARPQGIVPVSVKLDGEGIVATALDEQLSTWDESLHRRPRVLYTIPTGQNPTGGTLSAERRLALYKVCQKHDIMILEDEPYYFLQMQPYKADAVEEPLPKTSTEFLSTLVPSLLSIDTDGRVVRLDSLSKVIAPGVRCGWLTGSQQLMERALRSNEVSIQSPSGFSQIMLHSLLTTWGHAGYLNWLVHIRAEYTRRRDALLKAMDAELPKEYCHWDPPMAGMFVWFRIDHTKHKKFSELGIDALEKRIFLTAIDKEVLVAMGSWFISDKDAERPGLFFRATFAASSIPQMQEAMKRFGAALRVEFEE